MVAAHLVWGGTMALALRELQLAEREVLAGDAAPDHALSRRAAIPFL
jgi:hypothetical protein